MYVCIHVIPFLKITFTYCVCIHTYATVHMEVREQLGGFISFFPPCDPGIIISNLGLVASAIAISPAPHNFLMGGGAVKVFHV